MYIIIDSTLSILKKRRLDSEVIDAWKNEKIKIIWFPTEESDKEPLELKGILGSGVKQFGFIHE
jgi:hypothetical protein